MADNDYLRFSYDPALEEDPDFILMKQKLLEQGYTNLPDEGGAIPEPLSSITEVPTPLSVPSAVPILEAPTPAASGVMPQPVPDNEGARTAYLDEMVKKRLQAEADANTESELTGGQATAVGISALLPTILGALWAKQKGLGTTQGLAAGSKAGAAGAAVGLKGFAADQERARKLASTRSALYGKMEQDERKNAFSMAKQEDQQAFQGEEWQKNRDSQMERAKLFANRGSGVGGGLDTPYTPEQSVVASKLLKNQYVSPEEKAAARWTPRMESLLLMNKSVNNRSESLDLRERQYDRYVNSIEQSADLAPRKGATPNQQDKSRAQTIYATLPAVQRTILDYRSMLDEGASSAERVSQRQRLVLALKNLENMGANFTRLEANSLIAQLPWELDPNSPEFLTAMNRQFSSFDNKEALDKLLDQTEFAAYSKIGAYNFRPRNMSDEAFEEKLSYVDKLKEKIYGKALPRPKREDYPGDPAAYIEASRKWRETVSASGK